LNAPLPAAAVSPLDESITLGQAKKLIQCMAHEASFLLLAPPGVGKSEMVYQAAREAGLACRSLLGTQIAPEDVSGVPRILGERSVFCPPRLLLPEKPEAFCLGERRAAALQVRRVGAERRGEPGLRAVRDGVPDQRRLRPATVTLRRPRSSQGPSRA
jgi:hypothetical protein